MRGQGEAGPYGGPPGDFYVTIRIKPHPYLTRQGLNLIYEAKINFAQATLGAEINVPTIKGEKILRVPSGTQNGTTLRMRGEGIHCSYGKGDQLVRIEVLVPEKLTRRQHELVEELGKEFEADELGKRQWWRR
jgi:molecular chaperone DnaJ